jgi:hypothetical protein
MPHPENPPLTDAQLATQYRDALEWVAENAHCIETRRFVARVFRAVDDAKGSSSQQECVSTVVSKT